MTPEEIESMQATIKAQGDQLKEYETLVTEIAHEIGCSPYKLRFSVGALMAKEKLLSDIIAKLITNNNDTC